MKNRIKLLGFIALIAVIGFSMIACDDDGDGDDGSIKINGWTFYAWSDYGDSGGTSTIAISSDGNKVKVTGNLTKECVTGENWTIGYATFTMVPPADLLSQVETSEEFSFNIIGDGNTYNFEVGISDVKDYGYHSTSFTTDNGVQKKITISFSDLEQPGWATPIETIKNITSLRIQVSTDFFIGPYSFTLVVE